MAQTVRMVHLVRKAQQAHREVLERKGFQDHPAPMVLKDPWDPQDPKAFQDRMAPKVFRAQKVLLDLRVQRVRRDQ